MGTANCIATAAGDRITPPKAKIPTTPPASPAASPLTREVATVIGERWIHGADYMQIADAVIEKIAHHIRTSSLSQLHGDLADAIEDNMHVDPMEGDVDQASECSIEDIEAHRARKAATLSVYAARQSYTDAECEGMVGAMLKRPSETNRYLGLRSDGHTPASALAIVLNERKERAARMKGGAA